MNKIGAGTMAMAVVWSRTRTDRGTGVLAVVRLVNRSGGWHNLGAALRSLKLVRDRA